MVDYLVRFHYGNMMVEVVPLSTSGFAKRTFQYLNRFRKDKI